ncbi:uncharacterized protein ACN427_009979 [Glossina fuscipes fuscipes]
MFRPQRIPAETPVSVVANQTTLHANVIIKEFCSVGIMAAQESCRHNAGQHIQARGMTMYESIERGKAPSDAAPKIIEMIGSTLVASLTIGGLAATGVVDTGATKSIISKDFIGFMLYIISSETRSYTIRMVDGASKDTNRSITVEVNVGNMSSNLELCMVRTLGMDFLAKTGAELTVPGYPVKLGSRNSTPTTTAAAKGTRASGASEISPTPDRMVINSSKPIQAKTLERTTEVRKTRTISLITGNITAKAATTRSDIPRPKYETHERVINATVRSARVFKELQSVTTQGDTTITITASRKTNKNKKDKEYQNCKSKAGKDNVFRSKNNINNRGLCLRHCPKQGQFTK